MLSLRNPFDKEGDFFPELTSLLDVMFLLLIFFMLTTSFEKEGKIEALTFELPQSTHSQQIIQDQALVISVENNGGYTINDKQCSSASLADVIGKSLVGNTNDSVVVISASKDAPFQSIVHIYDAFQALGIRNFSFLVR